jgi:hypothetical protein
MIPLFLTNVSGSALCRIQVRLCSSRFWSRVICFPRCPRSSKPCAAVVWTCHRRHWNALVSALMETGILSCDSAMSVTYAIFCHRNSSRRKSASPCQHSQTRPVKQNERTPDKMISNALRFPRHHFSQYMQIPRSQSF